MIIHSDWHIHSEFSYDATSTLEAIALNAKDQGLSFIGITDHANYNDKEFLGDLYASAAGVKAAREKYPFMIAGVELTPIAKPVFDYIVKTGIRKGYTLYQQSDPYDIELAATKEELISLGVRYAVSAAHWRVDKANAPMETELDENIKEWYRQQLWLACDERTTILGHPWYHPYRLWYDDFSIIPRSMNMEIAAALKENGKYVECNSQFFKNPRSTEKFRHQYAEFLRELFEKGIPVTYGSDSHVNYGDLRADVEKYLIAAGFSEGDFSEIAPEKLW
jgi:histidinol phosphatase-like PHP family hydrolase